MPIVIVAIFAFAGRAIFVCLLLLLVLVSEKKWKELILPNF